MASIVDLILLKEAAGRPKDRAQVELLRATAEELARTGLDREDASDAGA